MKNVFAAESSLSHVLRRTQCLFLCLVSSCTHHEHGYNRHPGPVQEDQPQEVSVTLDTRSQSIKATIEETLNQETLCTGTFQDSRESLRLMLVGDSLAVGMGHEFSRIARSLHYTVNVHAKVGSTTRQWIKWIDRDLTVYRPDIVFVSLGTNDAAAPNALTLWPDMYEVFAAKVRDSGATLVWIGPPEVTSSRVKKLTEVRHAIRSVAPLYFGSEALRINQWDGIHTDADGYETWIRHVWDSAAAAGIVRRRE